MQQVLYKAGGREKVWGYAMHVKKFNISDVASAVEDGWFVHPKDAIEAGRVDKIGGTSVGVGTVSVGSSQDVIASSGSLISADDLQQLRDDLAHSDGLVESLTADNDSLKSQLEEKNGVIDERNERINSLIAELEQLQAQSTSVDGKEEEKPEEDAGDKKATRGRAK